MSKNETIQTNSKDIFSTCHESVDRLFNGIKQSVPRYHQSITNVQQECLQVYETVMNSSITLQKEYLKKSGVVSNLPEVTVQIIYNITEKFVKASSVQNQTVLTTIDAIQQHIKVFNDNTKSFTDLNRNILQFWIPVFSTKNNN